MTDIYEDKKSAQELFLSGLGYGWKTGEIATSTYRGLPDPQPVYIDDQRQRRMHHGEAGLWIILGSAIIGGLAYSLIDDQDTKDKIASLTGFGVGLGLQLVWDDREDYQLWFR